MSNQTESDQEPDELISRLEHILVRLEKIYEVIDEEELESFSSSAHREPQPDNDGMLTVLDEISPTLRTLPSHAPKSSLPLLEISDVHPDFKDHSHQTRFEWLLKRCKKDPSDLAMHLLKDSVNDLPLCELVGTEKAKELTDCALQLIQKHETKCLASKKGGNLS